MEAVKRGISRAIAKVIRWAAIESTGSDDTPYPWQQVSFLDRTMDSAVWFPYGLHALAPPESLALMWAISGQGESLVHMPGSPRERVRLKEGEVVLYHPGKGAKIHFKADGSVDLTATGDVNITSAASVNVTAPAVAVTAPAVAVTGALSVTGNAELDADLNHDGANVGFRGSAPVAKATVTGFTGGIIPLQQVLTALDDLGLITDSST